MDLPSNMIRGFKQMQEQCNRMNILVEDLLILTRLDNSLIDQALSPIKIKSLIEEIRLDAIDLSANKQQNIEIYVDDQATVMALEPELRSAISNLVFNAVNYSGPKSKIQIKWQENDRISMISVIDNGPGIDNNHIPRLTERFYRVDQSHNSKTGGTGLGLAIVKHILQRHNGYLDIQSTLGIGSEFHLVFNKSQ